MASKSATHLLCKVFSNFFPASQAKSTVSSLVWQRCAGHMAEEPGIDASQRRQQDWQNVCPHLF